MKLTTRAWFDVLNLLALYCCISVHTLVDGADGASSTLNATVQVQNAVKASVNA